MPVPSEFILTKIIATLGPACAEIRTVTRLVEEGARVFRINFSHGGFEGFAKSLELIREAERRTGVSLAALGDICGPKIRVGKVVDGGVRVEAGDRVEFQATPLVAQAKPAGAPPEHAIVFSTTLASMIEDVEVGQRLLIDDGAVRMLVIDKTGAPGNGEARRLACNVTVGGLITSAKGINLPDSALNVPSMTEYDFKCAQWAIENKLDYLALSFVRKAADVLQLREFLAQRSATIPIIAKIEKPQALDDLDAIIEAAQGVMVARGDLGVEMDLAQVPVIQKRIIGLCHDYGKPVIVATQMLQSMIESASPTRAEVSDVANAIYDGADAVMLSGETAVGKYPQQAVHMMARTALTTQRHLASDITHGGQPPQNLRGSKYRTAALAHGVGTVVRDLEAHLIVIWSQQGGGARYLSQNRPNIPIIAASSERAILRRMALMFAVTPVFMEKPANVEDFVVQIDRLILDRQWAQRGEAMVVVAGEPIGIAGVTNALSVRYVGEAGDL